MRFLVGDMFESRAATLVNTVNCVGVMGKGVAKVFKERYPEMYKDYRMRCEAGEVRPGEPYAYSDLFGVRVINFPTKDHWRSSSRLSYIEHGLDWFAENWRRLGLSSVAFPPLGCGNGGLQWEVVGPVMYERLRGIPIDIEVYAPFGTPDDQLTEEYLESRLASLKRGAEVVGERPARYDPRWDAILYVLRELELTPYTLPVGHTAYQKICYMLERSGVDLGFDFQKREYGPFSDDAREALRIMAVSGKVKEERLGEMVHVVVDPGCGAGEALGESRRLSADRVVDLFSRLGNTRQAEEVATIVYCYDALAREEGDVVDGSAILEMVYEWKPRWRGADRAPALESGIDYLSAFGWISAGPLLA